MHRVMFFSGHPYEIYSYGFCLVLAMLAGLVYATRRAPRFGLNRDQVLDLSLALLLGGMVGGRVLSIACDYEYYAHAPLYELFNIRAGGLAWHGALAGGLIGFVAYRLRSGLPSGALVDLVTPPVLVGHVIGRVGCFLNGCCVGRACALPWAVTYPDAPQWGGIARHPTQIYEALAEVAILVFIATVWERRPRPSGSTFLVYFLLYATARFFIEFVREEPLLWGGLDLAQCISIGMIVFSVTGLAMVYRRAPAQPDEGEVSPAGA